MKYYIKHLALDQTDGVKVASKQHKNYAITIKFPDGTELKKYPVDSVEDLIASTNYFIKNAFKFPADLREQIATNLLHIHDFYNIDPDEDLVKFATKDYYSGVYYYSSKDEDYYEGILKIAQQKRQVTRDQVLKLLDKFEQTYSVMKPEKAVEKAKQLLELAKQFDIKQIPFSVMAFASDSYKPINDIITGLAQRMLVYSEEAKQKLNKMLSNIVKNQLTDEANLTKLYNLVRELDKQHGLPSNDLPQVFKATPTDLMPKTVYEKKLVRLAESGALNDISGVIYEKYMKVFQGGFDRRRLQEFLSLLTPDEKVLLDKVIASTK